MATEHLKQVRQRLFVLVFSVITTLVIIATVLTFSINRWYLENMSTNQETQNLDSASWSVAEASPSGSSDGSFNLVLNSSIGNIRRYSAVRSYGISADGKYLAISNDAGLQVVNLTTDTSQEIQLGFAFSGDSGEAISWSPDGRYMAFIARAENQPEQASLIVVSRQGELMTKSSGFFTYYTQGGRNLYFPARFSPTNNLILTRTFINEAAVAAQDPVELKVFNVDGGERKVIYVRDEVPAPDQVVYTWNRAGDSILYRVDSVGTAVDYSKEHSFTRIVIGI